MLALLLLQIPDPLPAPQLQELPGWAWALIAGGEGLVITLLGASVIFFLRAFFEKVSAWDEKLAARVAEAVQPVSDKIDRLSADLHAHTVSEAESRGKTEAELDSQRDRLERVETVALGVNRRRG